MSTGIIIMALLGLGVLLLLCWRMAIGLVAARPVSKQLLKAAWLNQREASGELGPADFEILEMLCTATGALSDARAIGPIRAYYRMARGVGRIAPSLGSWSRKEMVVCSRYLAARVGRQLTTNIICSHESRSF